MNRPGETRPLYMACFAAIVLVATSWLTCSEELEPPVARIVGPYTALVGAVVQLDGSTSSDPEGGSLFFSWTFKQKPADSRSVFNDPSLVTPAFVADREGQYQVELIVSNGLLQSLPVTHTLQVGPCGGHPPVVAAIATDPAVPVVGDTVRFSAQITDEDLSDSCLLAQTFDYDWRLFTVPAGSSAVLADSAQSNPWMVVDRSGVYALELVVTDSAGWSSEPVLFTFNVSTCGEAAPVVEEIVANPPNPPLGELVVLSATVVDSDNDSTCNLGQQLSYHWQLTEVPVGSLAVIERSDLEVTWFWPDVSGSYVVTLVVTDSTGLASQPAHLELTAGPCGDFPPVVESIQAEPEDPDVGEIVTLTADVYDPDNEEGCDANQELFFNWQIVAGPAGTLSRIEEPTWEETWFLPDLPGDYLIRLVVTDSTGLSSDPAEILVTVGVCGSRPPIIEGISADPLAPNTGDMVQLRLTVTDEDTEDPCDDVSQFYAEWWFQEKPGGSLAALSDPRLSNPTFVADMPGDYVINARVTDPRGLTSQVAQLVVTASECGAAPPVATLTANPSAPIIGQQVLLRAEVVDADMDDGSEDDTCTLPESFTYLWRFVQVPTESLSEIRLETSQNASFVPDSPGLYVIECLVHDAMGHRNVAGEEGDLVVQVQVADCGDAPPVVEEIAAVPALPYTGDIVLLSADVTDADQTCGEDQLLTYDWRIIQMPSGSLAQLNNPGGENPWFSADTPGPFMVRLVVTDSTDRSSIPEDITVEVSPCGSAAPEVTSAVPTPNPANIGQRVELEIEVNDVDNNIGGCEMGQRLDTVSWFASRPSGSRAELNPPEGLHPSFIPDVPGVYVVRTRVTDDTGRCTESDAPPVTAAECGGAPPFIEEVTVTVEDLVPEQYDVGNLVTLNITPSDADNTSGCLGEDVLQTLTVTSWFVSLPAGSTAALTPAEGLTPSFVADVPGTYLVRSRVTDDTGLFGEKDTSVLVDTCGSNPPMIQVGHPTIPDAELIYPTGARVELLVQADDLDVLLCRMDQTLTVTSGFVSRPAGSRAELAPAEGIHPSFVADVPGPYLLRSVVDDGTGRTAEVITPIEVTDCGNATPWVEVDPSGSLNIGEPVILVVTPHDADLPDEGDCELEPQILTVHSAFVSRPAGSTARLAPAEGLTPTFVPDVQGPYIVRTSVDDGTGRSSFKDTTIQILTCGGNPPQIDESIIITPAVRNVGDLVTLTLTASDEDDECGLDSTRTVHSTFLSRPPGSIAVLSPAEGLQPAFVADRGGDYLIRATVTDATGRSSFKDIPVSVKVCGGQDPELTVSILLNGVPYDPDVDQVNAGDQITLLTVATDPDNANIAPDNCNLGQQLTIHSEFGQRPPGSTATLIPAEGSEPTFVPDVRGWYVIQTTVTDPTGRTDLEITGVEVSDCGDNPPVIELVVVTAVGGDPANIDVGDLITLDITATDDDTLEGCAVQGQPQLSSQFIQRPSGSLAALNPSEGSEPAFVPDRWGTYIIRSTAVDATGRSATKETTVSVIECGDYYPEVSIIVTVEGVEVPADEVNTGDLVTLEVTAIDRDNYACEFDPPQVITLSSAFVSRPAGSQAVLVPAEGNLPSFVADVSGPFWIRTTADDGTGRATSVDTEFNVRDCGDHVPTFDLITIIVGMMELIPPDMPNTGDLVHLALVGIDEDNTLIDCCPTPPCQTLTYDSWFLSRPAGSSTELTPAEGTEPAFLADRPGTYLIRSQVEDGTGRSSFQDTTVQVGVCGSHPPVAVIEVIQPENPTYVPGEPYLVPSGSTVVLNASASTDGEEGCLPEPQPLSFYWSLLQTPAGSTATFLNPTLVQPYLVTDIPGSYVVLLSVNDGRDSGTAQLELVADPADALVPGQGLSITLVDGGSTLWNQPEGIAWDGGTDIYVVQNGSDMVTRTYLDGGAWVTEPFSTGLWLNNPHDIVYYPTSSLLLVSDETDNAVISLNTLTGEQQLFTTAGAVSQPSGVDLVQIGTTNYLVAVDQTRRALVRFEMLAPNNYSDIDLEGGDSFINPWGVQAEVVSGTTRYWSTSTFLGYLRRLTPAGTGYDRVEMTTILSSPHDILYSSDVDALLVADSGSGRILWVDHCPNPTPIYPCQVVPLVSGLVRPYGLAFGPDNSLLVTDRGTNNLYQVTYTTGDWW